MCVCVVGGHATYAKGGSRTEECQAADLTVCTGKLGGSGQRVETFDIHSQRKGQLLLKTSLRQWLSLGKLQKWRTRLQLEQEKGSVQAMEDFAGRKRVSA